MAKPGQSAASSSAEKTEGKTKIGGLPLYYIYKDGSGYEHKVANMAHPLICERKGIVEVECIKKSNILEPNFTICTVMDRELGIIFGVPQGIDNRTKDIKWQRFKLGDFKRYDLSKQHDAIEWAVIRRAPWLIGSMYQKGKPYFKMHDKEAEARIIIMESKMRKRATDIAEKMVTIDEMADMYRNFGNNPEGFSPVMLQAEISKIAQRSPKEFLEVWDNSNREIITIFNRCEQLGLINYSANNATYMWKESLPLGMTKSAAIKYMADNPSTLNQAKIESESRDYVMRKIKSENKAENIDAVEVDEELIQLRAMAKIMKVPNYGNLSKEELQSKVDEMSEVA